MTSVIAMFYLAIFSMLAVGFYSSVTTQVQLSYNDMNINAAQAAAESGMQYVRYQLSSLSLSPATPNNQLVNTIYSQLGVAMNSTGNLGANTVGLSGSQINLPGTAGTYIDLDSSGARFFASIVPNAAFPTPNDVVVKVTGQARGGQIQRAVQMNFYAKSVTNSAFNFGVASRGWITMNGSTRVTGAVDPTMGSVLAATSQNVTALSMSGAQQISGDASFVNPAAVTSFTGTSTIAGYTPGSSGFNSHLHKGIPMPSFPTIDASPFAVYATNTWTAAVGTNNVTLTNMILPAGTYTFAGNTNIQGVLLVRTPSKITFAGNLTIKGAIVCENNPQGTSTTNTMTFAGNVSSTGIDTLPANATFPAGERALTGAFLLTPIHTVTFTGNFGTVNGSIIADSLSFSGNAGGTVNGSVIGLADKAMSFNGNAAIAINNTSNGSAPVGTSIASKFVARPNSYAEVLP